MRRYVLLLVLLLFIMPVQAWQIEINNTNLFPSQRINDSIYYNNNSNPLIVIITDLCAVTKSKCSFYLDVNGTIVQRYLEDGLVGGQSRYNTIYQIIPINSSYFFSIGEGNQYIYWYEWKTTDTPTQEETDTTNELLTIVAFSILFIVIYILYKEIVRK